MRTIHVTAERDYPIEISVKWANQLRDVSARHNRLLILAPVSMKSILSGLDVFTEQSGDTQPYVFWVPDGESQKSVSVVESLWNFCGELNLQRSDAIVGIGGGATTDLAGFVAATWLRGIDWYAFPTSLAAMVDASVGGKTGINTSAGKNLVGSFHSPSLVAIDLTFLDSLSDRDFSAGLAEVIKCGFIADGAILDILSECADVSEARQVAEELVYRSLSVKARVVGVDFKESKAREVLNYGHTAGHAIEKLSGYEMRHGEAVAVGLVYAARLSQMKLGLSDGSVDMHSVLLRKFNLPLTSDFSFEEVLKVMTGDKKARSGQIRFIGISAVGSPGWIETPTSDELRTAYESITK